MQTGVFWLVLAGVGGFLNAWHSYDPTALDSLSNVGWGYDDGSGLDYFNEVAMSTAIFAILLGGAMVAHTRTTGSPLASEANASMVALAVEGQKPSFAYIVTKMRSQYFKKATGTTTFTCNDGDKIFSAVDKALKTKEGMEIEAKTTGTLDDGTIVSEFYFTWSIKQRKK